MGFVRATKENLYIKMALTGPSGSGKTYGALMLSLGLGGKTALLDTEYGSASLYADIFDFDVWEGKENKDFSPEYFIDVINESEKAGYTNLIIDSLTHEWSGVGGCLDLADKIGKAKYKGNSFAAWADVTPRHNRLVEKMMSAKLNIIATMRSKTEYIITEISGKMTPKKVGLGTIQRDGLDYEFTLVFDLDRDSHVAIASKDRTRLFSEPVMICQKTGIDIKKWLSRKTNDIQKQVVYGCIDDIRTGDDMIDENIKFMFREYEGMFSNKTLAWVFERISAGDSPASILERLSKSIDARYKTS